MERGCEWVGTVGTLEEHVATCEFTLVPCSKQCKDDNDEVKCFMRKALDKHLNNDCPNRDYECQSRCGEKGTYAYITEEHDKICKMKILPCPNAGCGTRIQRQDVSEHVSKCPHTVIPCKYKGIGCDTELKRGDMAAHEQDDKLHLHMALETVNTLQQTTNFQQVSIDSQLVAIDSLQVKVDLLQEGKLFVLSEYQKKKEANEKFQFPPFYSHPHGYHMALRVDANGWGAAKGTHVSVYAPILEGEYDAELKWPFIGKITFTLLNQLEDKNHKIETRLCDATHNARVGNARGFNYFTPHSALAHDPVKNTQYLKDDKLYFRITVEAADYKPWLLS